MVGTDREAPEAPVRVQLLGLVSVVADGKELARYRARYQDHVGLDTRVGRWGLERSHEDLLLGRLGRERQTRNDDGDFEARDVIVPPRVGGTLALALTSEACVAAEAALERWGGTGDYHPQAQPSGGFVAIEAGSGEVVAWGEMPRLEIGRDLERLFDEVEAGAEYDPDAGRWRPAGGVDPPGGESAEEFQRRISKPAPRHLSRVSQIAVEPGSTFKVAIGLGLLEGLHHMPPGTLLPWESGFDCLSRTVQPGCHAHPPVGFATGLAYSCNRFFALSLRDAPAHWAVYRRTVPLLLDRLGFGRPTGVDVWGESPGILLRDWVDFDAREVAARAAAKVRGARGLPAAQIRMDVRPRTPALVAGRDPARLEGLLVCLLESALDAVGPGAITLSVSPGERRDRFLDLCFEVVARPHPDGPLPRPLDLPALERAARQRGASLVAEVRPPGLISIAARLVYHEPIGRRPGEPDLILEDDGRNLGIGQGPITVTPLQMVRLAALVANGGRLVRPRVAAFADGVPVQRFAEDVGLDAQDLARVREGMRQAVTDPHGTASRAPWHGVPAAVHGKTGTAQVGAYWLAGIPPGPGTWHHWFVGFAEAPGKPTIAFACVLHSRRESSAARTAVHAACDFLTWWYAEGPGGAGSLGGLPGARDG